MSLSTAGKIDALLKDATSKPYHGLPRAVIMAADASSVLYSGASGYATLPPYSSSADLSSGTPIADSSIFQLWSCTKLVASISAMQLVEQGKMKLEDEAGKFVPEMNDVKMLEGFEEDGSPKLVEIKVPITVEMLITHTAGFAYSDHEKLAKYYSGDRKLEQPYGPRFTRAVLASIPLVNVPGEHWNYGMSLDWLTWVVEEVSGMDLQTYFQRNIFEPLGITDISFIENSDCIPTAHYDASATPPFTFLGTKGRISQEHFWGGAGLTGSPSSYLKIVQSLLPTAPTSLLKPETLDLMFTPRLKNDQQRLDLQTFSKQGNDPFTSERTDITVNVDASYGLGGLLSGRQLEGGRKSGSMCWSGVANTFWVADRKTGLAFVAFTNILPYGNKAMFDLWAKAEIEVYKGLEERRS